MRPRYVLLRSNGDRTRPLRLKSALRLARKQARRIGPRWRMKRRGDDEWGRWRDDLRSTMDRLTQMLKQAKVGDRIVVMGEQRPFRILIHKIDAAPPIKDTEGNSRIDEIYTYVMANYSRVRNGGICVRRYISGTNKWTQHSPWPAPDPGSNAWDIFLRTMGLMQDLAADLARRGANGTLPVGRVIIGDRVWTKGQGWHAYAGTYHTHVHVEGDPERSGTPQGSC